MLNDKKTMEKALELTGGCWSCAITLVNGGRSLQDLTEGGFMSGVRPYKGLGMGESRMLCSMHIAMHYQFPPGTKFSGAL